MATVAENATGQDISCQTCGAKIRLAPHQRAAICPYCASPSIVTRPPSADRPTPEFVIGFSLSHEQATQAVQRWISGSHMFARSDFKKAVPKLTNGVYLPAYLYGAVADSRYQASIGENYTETETYTTTDSNGKTVTRTRTVVRTEWRDLSGSHRAYAMDVIVSASSGVSNESLEAIEPFDLRMLRRYDDSYLSGWMAEEPSRKKQQCFQLAHDESIAKINTKLKNFMPGDSYRNLQFRTQLSNEVIDLVLLPVWSFAVRYADDQPPLQILVNGQTGRVGGKVPVSTAKVTAAVLVAIVLIGIVVILIMMGSN